jgi:CheY-like chemotaxis protein
VVSPQPFPAGSPIHSNVHAPNILVVDHAPEILELMCDLLEEEHRVTTQPQAEQDIGTIAEVSPDPIVIDYMWPRSDDAWTLLSLLHIGRRPRHMRIIVCTAVVAQVGPMQGHFLCRQPSAWSSSRSISTTWSLR